MKLKRQVEMYQWVESQESRLVWIKDHRGMRGKLSVGTLKTPWHSLDSARHHRVYSHLNILCNVIQCYLTVGGGQ